MHRFLILVCLLFSTLVHANAAPDFYGVLHQASVNHASIAYYRFGHGKPLVMITGHGDSMMMWHPDFLKKMSEDHEVIIFDYPGIGQSTAEGGYPNTMDQLSAVVDAFIKTQNLVKPDLLGFSMGGSLLLYMTTQYGSQYDHIIVIGAKAGGKKTVVPEAKYFNMLSNTSISPSVAIKTLLFPASAGKQADEYLKMLGTMPNEKMEGEALQAQAAAVTLENNGAGIWDKLPLIKNEVLVINGTEDILTPVQNAVLISSAIPDAWLAQVKGAGHGVLFQEPVMISKLVEVFLLQ